MEEKAKQLAELLKILASENRLMMKKSLIILTCATLLCSCGINVFPAKNSLTNEQGENFASTEGSFKTVYQKISAEEARKIMESGIKFILLDVRTDEEYKQKRISGSILIPDFEIAKRAEVELRDKNATILIYCRSGRRSANAAQKLVDMGYTNIYDFGGIINWPYETISD